MLYSTLKSLLPPLCPCADISLASKIDPNWEGVAVEVNSIIMVIYPVASVSGNGSDLAWNVDIMDQESYDPDVYDFEDVYAAIGFVVATHLKLTSI